MIDSEKLSHLQHLIPEANTFLVVLGPQATLDQVATATGLYSALQAAGKDVSLLSPSELSPEAYPLELLNEVRTQLGNRDLSISFAYQPEAVDKVSYHIDEESQRFCLVIKPQKGAKPVDNKTVEFEYTGAEADLIFLVGVHNLESLEQLYFGYEQLYTNTNLVTLHTFEPNVGNIKIDTSGTSCMSETTAQLLQQLQLSISAEAATNLLIAIQGATNEFQSLVATAETFETVAYLLRSGARRMTKQPSSLAQAFQNSRGTTLLSPETVTPSDLPDNGFGETELLAEAAPIKRGRKNTKDKVGGLSHEPSVMSGGTRG